MTSLPPPDPGFLPGIAIDTRCTASGTPVVTLYHPHAHALNDGVGSAMLAIASRLGLRYGRHLPRTGEYIYDLYEGWFLDYGHPRDVLHFTPDFLWPHMVRGAGGAVVAVSLEHEPRPVEDERILTGRLALRRRPPRTWPSAR
ncbi:hypothetical protein EF903_06800 [Streptomyces sp. WAC05292]|uniref:hypothetical protein n=1 Tax=Streptomyces sp. WAC05292 TaxID=2487418 RepID=UPI000F737336|nr:hypothetical protein [Streptomyces sp. WAC05292]RSS94241.1 hypothetical protein EF903_06800 [Streptomyces sp. WAC05292]